LYAVYKGKYEMLKRVKQ